MPADWGDSFINSTHDFIDAIKEGRDPVLTGERGRAVLAFALAAIDSSACKKEVYLDQYQDKPAGKRLGFFAAMRRKNHD